MGKKKPFIDKKKASTYHLLYRSQRDVADGEDESSSTGGVILWPSPNNKKETDEKVLLGTKGAKAEATHFQDDTLSRLKSQLSEAGLVDDFDYEKHTKPITGDGKYFSTNAVTLPGTTRKEVGAMIEARALDVKDEIIQEVDRQLDSIALTSDCMDDEIAQMLFGDFEEGEFEELNDEFVLDAAREPQASADGAQAFDFAAHVQGLIDKAKMESDYGIGQLSTIHEQGRRDQEFFAKAKRVNKACNEDEVQPGSFDESDSIFDMDGTPGIVSKLTQVEERALCDKFNETLAEYDSDELGEGYDCDEMLGHRPIEGDTLVEAALADYLQEREDDVFMQGSRRCTEQKNGGSGFSVLVETRMVPVKDIEAPANEYEVIGDIRPMSEILHEAEDTLKNPRSAPPTEEIFIDGKSYFSEKIRNPWDCESILSTYSNLDNNPINIGSGSHRRRRRKPRKYKTDLGDEIIKLSEKTGLPVLPTSSDDSYSPTIFGDDTCMSVNKGERRSKNESAEEKKLRKLNVKKERQLARMQKKMMKEAFNDEFKKRQQGMVIDEMGGRSVVRL